MRRYGRTYQAGASDNGDLHDRPYSSKRDDEDGALPPSSYFSLARMHSAVVALEPCAGLANETVPRHKLVLVTVGVGIPVATEGGGGNRPGSSDRACGDSCGSSSGREDAGITGVAPTVPAVPIVGPPIGIWVARALILAVRVRVELCAVAGVIDHFFCRSGSRCGCRKKRGSCRQCESDCHGFLLWLDELKNSADSVPFQRTSNFLP